MSRAHDLSRTPIHLDGDGAQPVADFDFTGASFERYVSTLCKDDDPGRLLMIEATPTDWPAWECHTLADEVVFVLEGKGEFIHETADGEVRIPVGPGSAVINPKGVWHTADVVEPIRAIYMTPCPGTEHRAR